MQAKEKEERYLRRQQRRAELDAKMKEILEERQKARAQKRAALKKAKEDAIKQEENIKEEDIKEEDEKEEDEKEEIKENTAETTESMIFNQIYIYICIFYL